MHRWEADLKRTQPVRILVVCPACRGSGWATAVDECQLCDGSGEVEPRKRAQWLRDFGR